MWRRKLFRSRNISIATKMRAFRTLVMSVLLYGAETWAVTKQDTWKLKTFQMRCLRDILGVSRWNMLRNTVVLKRTGELLVGDQLRQRCLQWLGHLWRMPDHRIQKQLMRCRPSGRRRPPGGAPLRWSDLVNRDLTGVSKGQELIEDGMLQLANQTCPCGSNLQILPNVLKDMVTRGEEEEVCAHLCVVFDLHCVCHCVCVRASSVV